MTRNEITQIAYSLIGIPYVHQGRSDKGIDCVGLLAIIAQRLNYPHTDLESYRRTPSATKLIELLRENLDEIDLNEVDVGDIFLMKLGGTKPRHTAILASNATDFERGLQPTIIHALNSISIQSVVEQPLSIYRGQLVKGFRFRGLQP